MPSLTGRIAQRLPFFYGWIVIAVAFVTLGLGANARTTYGLLFPPILAEFGWDRAMTASIFSIGFFSAALYAPLIGHCLDRFGPRIVMPVGATLVSLGLAGATVSSEPWHFYLTLGGLVVGASTLMTYNSHFVFLPNWFDRRRGFAIGLACTGVGIIAYALLPWMQVMINELGWRNACLVLAAVMMVGVVPLNILLQRKRPQDLGLGPDGDALSQAPRPAPAAATPSTAPPLAVQDWTLARAMRTGRFWLVGAAFFCALFIWYSILVHQTKYLLDIGFDTRVAADALALVPLLGIAGQIGLGALSDRIGREWVWTASCLGFAACYVLLILLETNRSVLLVYLMALAQGGLGYSMVAVYGAIPADIFRGRQYGLIYGTLSLIGSMGAAFGPWLFGKLRDVTGSYASAFAISIALSLVSTVFVWLAAPRKARAQAAALAAATR
jgi:MFS family permease